MEFNWNPYLMLLLGSSSTAKPSSGGFEGGNDDDPHDPGGRTSRGILQREWNVFRKTRPGRPADVWQAPQVDVVAIYHDGQYWAGQRCAELPSGVDVNTMDYGVNSGVGRSGRVLRHICGLPTTTYKIDDTVIAAVKKRDATAVTTAICAERLAFLKSLPTYPRYRGGWVARVNKMLAFGKGLIGRDAIVVQEPPSAPAPGKAVHPEPKVLKNTIGTGTGTAGGGLGYTFFDWISAHPYTSAAVAFGVLLGVYFVIKYINDSHHAKNVTPMPGTTVVPESA